MEPQGRFTPVFDGLWRNPGAPIPHSAEFIIGRRFAPTRWLHAGYAATRLFQPHILGEVVIVAAFAGEVPAHRLSRIAAAEHVRKKALLRRPSGLRLRLAVAARHGVV